MSTNYPGSLDAYARPGAADNLNSPSHSGVEDNQFDAVEAMEAVLGITAAFNFSRAATKTVAANDSTTENKANADYICNGTDDEVTINSAVDAVVAAGGGTVLLFEGTCLISDNIIVRSNVRLMGQGDGSIIKIKDSADAFTDAGVVRMKYSGTYIQNAIVENFAIDGNKSNQANGTNKMGVYAEIINCVIRNLYVHDSPTYGLDPHETDPSAGFSQFSLITGNRIIDCGDASIGDHDGITLDKCDRFIVSNNIVGGSSRHGISLVTGTVNTMIIGNIVYDSGDNGINLNNASGDDIENCMVANNFVYSNTLTGIYVTDASRIAITGNNVFENQRRGIRIFKAQYCSIVGNVVHDNSQESNNSYDEIYLSNDIGVYSTNCTVVGNVCYSSLANKARYSIAEQSSSDDNNLIANNNVDGAVSGGVNKAGTNSRVHNNLGHVTENSGTGTITDGNTSATITHGLDVTPTVDDIKVTLAENPTNDPGNIYVDNITSTQFDVNCRNDPGGNNLDFGWSASVI